MIDIKLATMNKPYLLIAGDNLYPSDGTGDWIKCYESVAEAREKKLII